MRYLLILVFLSQLGCKSPSDKNALRNEVTGNWFFVYPDEILSTKRQEKVYAAIQDSLVTGKGVKLVSFLENGTFIQWDSTIRKGKWGILEDKQVVVNGAGKGFENFKAVYQGTTDKEMILTEVLNADGEKIKINWHLKKISSGKAAQLFDPENNKWRNTPTANESDEEIKKRLSKMLAYYSVYFKLVSEESSYFMPIRIMLPLRFYQHAIGMNEFDEKHRFVSLFQSSVQAKKAYDILKVLVNNSTYNYSKMDSYSLEYSYMLEKLSEDIVK